MATSQHPVSPVLVVPQRVNDEAHVRRISGGTPILDRPGRLGLRGFFSAFGSGFSGGFTRSRSARASLGDKGWSETGRPLSVGCSSIAEDSTPEGWRSVAALRLVRGAIGDRRR